MRAPFPFVLVVSLALAPRPSSARSAPAAACVRSLNAAGAKMGTLVAARAVRCIRDAGLGRLRNTTAERCLQADPGRRIARATRKTLAVFKRRCRVISFGPQSGENVNAAFADLVRLHPIFGTPVDAALIDARTDRPGAACQLAVVRGIARLATARIAEFRACAERGLRRGRTTSAAGLEACLAAPAGRRATRARAAAQALVDRRCAGVAMATTFPGECARRPAAELLACAEQQAECGVCLAVDAANTLAHPCHTFVDGIATPYCGDRPVTTQSIARQWDEEALAAIRRDNPRPPVHARNLFHVSVAMYDAWAAYDATAKPYVSTERTTATDVATAREIAIAFAAYRVLAERYAAPLALGADASQASFTARMAALGFDSRFTATAGTSPAALGNRIAAAVIAAGKVDGANEDANYADPSYHAVNEPLVVKVPDIDFATIHDPNRWQPLALDVMIGQNGVPLPGNIQPFVGARWGGVRPFALTYGPGEDLYLDPGPAPQLGGATDAAFKAQVLDVIQRAGALTPDDGVVIDISPASYGNNPVGSNDGHGYPVNPVTGQPYTPQLVPRGDFGRVIAEYWADGPTSETPPGHWNVIANLVTDTPGFARRLGGTGPTLDPLEWDVKTYFAVNAAVHDAAIACWGAKRKYDGVRPITMIRLMGKKGQSSDALQPSYDPMGLPLQTGLIEVITPESAAERHAPLVTAEAGGHVGNVALHVWPGAPADPLTQHSGVVWMLAKAWSPYQRNTFVTPAFPGYFSGHSTFSRSAAEVLVRLTGSEYFPGGLLEFTAPKNAFLRFEIGPSVEVRLQWARYYDAADQAGQSRLWGGIHVQADDFTGRTRGALIGTAVVDLAQRYFDGTAP